MTEEINFFTKIRKSLSVLLKRYLLTGLATLFPVILTISIFFTAIHYSEKFIGKYVNALLQDLYGFTIPGLGLFVLIAVTLSAGIFFSHYLGRKIFDIFEHLFKRIPFISNVYPSAKQLSNFLFEAEKKDKFKKVVLVEYPEAGSYSIGFVTNEGMQEFDTAAEMELICIFVPLVPLPFSGLMLLLPRKKIKPIDISVDKAIKFIVSGGVIAPS